MADIQTTIKNGLAVSPVPVRVRRNAEGVYSGRRFPFFSATQNRMAALYGQYADNCYSAQMQGYDPEDFYKYWPVEIRCEDVAREATGTNINDDVKGMVVYYPEGVNYVPIGAHVEFATNTWLVTNPGNISAILTESIIRRCNAVYRRLDWYGNVLECPFNISKVTPRGAQDDYTRTMILADHYFQCSMQINDVSEPIRENTRLILGDAAYSVRGLDNFTQEFTGDFDSTHIMHFQIQREEKLSVYDDMERKIADGLSFSWDISIAGAVSMRAGQTQTLTASSTRNGIPAPGDAQNPVSYLWESSDTSVLEIDADGVVTAVGEGEAVITCALAQNPEITETAEIQVVAASNTYVAFFGAIPDQIVEQENAVISAALYDFGQATDEPLTYILSGPSEDHYSVFQEGNTLTIWCWERSDIPLTVTAIYHADRTITVNGVEVTPGDLITINGTEYTLGDTVTLNGSEVLLSGEVMARHEITLEAWSL